FLFQASLRPPVLGLELGDPPVVLGPEEGQLLVQRRDLLVPKRRRAAVPPTRPARS
ncbi:hypothetical protein THAOC_10922, partial [Thalassiosira oceanica]